MKSPYLRMIKGMENKMEELDSAPAPPLAGQALEPWFLYILQCNDGKLYTGITKDIQRRIKTHNDGKGAGFTRARRPVKLIYHESLLGRTQALLREIAVKALSRKQKEILIKKRKVAASVKSSIFAFPRRKI